MRALFDTNILLDIGLARKPFATDSLNCLIRLNEIGQPPHVAPHSLATFYYIVAQARDAKQAAAVTADLVATTEIVTFYHNSALRAIRLNFADFEDAMIAASAEAAELDCVITRNTKDFAKSPVPAMSPEEFLAQTKD